MWSKNICRLSSSLRLTRCSRALQASRYQCLENVVCTQTNRLHTSRHNASNNNEHKSSSYSSSSRWSKSYVVYIAGIGALATGYMLWVGIQKTYAAEKSSEPAKTKKTKKSKKTAEAKDTTSTNESSESKAEDKKTESEEIDWSLIPDIPSHVPYLLIGGGIASLEAFKAIITKDPYAKVLLIADEDSDPYWRPPLSKQFWFDDNKDAYKERSYTNMRGNKTSVPSLEQHFAETGKVVVVER